MYEEDKQTALEMYKEMYECVDDEQALSQFLVSPTRQAVVIARAYNQRERKLQVHTQAKAESLYDDDDDTPEYVIAIENVRAHIPGLIARKAAEREEASLFDDAPLPAATHEEEKRRLAAKESAAPAIVIPELPEAPVYEPEDLTEAEILTEPEKESEIIIPIEDAAQSEADEEIFEDKVHFDLPEAVAASEDIVFTAPPQPQSEEQPKAHSKERRMNPFLLVLYLIVSIPLGLLCIFILLFPTIIFLSLSALTVAVGVAAVSSVFGGFSIFADLMVVLGIGLIALALGLLFLWLFVWLIGGVMAGLVNAVIMLGKKLCYREVDA